MPQNAPVTVAIPVMNGGKLLRKALESVTSQTFSHLEIIVSDNASTDETQQICEEFELADSRIKYFRQSQRIHAVENFKFTAMKAAGKYLLWAAHDDYHSKNYIEVLLAKFISNQDASVIFSDVIELQAGQQVPVTPYLEPLGDCNPWSRCAAQLRLPEYHIYGLINREYLKSYDWHLLQYAPDKPILVHLAACGKMLYVPGATFYNVQPEQGKTAEQYALELSFRKPGQFLLPRVSYVCAKTAISATSGSTSLLRLGQVWLRFHLCLVGGWKGAIYAIAPRFLQRTWDRMKQRGRR